MKVLAASCAQRYGVSDLRTVDDAENAPILAINRMLGYDREPGFFTVRRAL